jgi:hypothetical protein
MAGVLLEILLTAAARAMREGRSWAEALEAGVEAMKFYGGATEVLTLFACVTSAKVQILTQKAVV